MTMAFANSNYYSSSGGSEVGNNFASYNAAGVNTGVYAPGLDLRSVFTDNSGSVLARAFNSRTIYKMGSVGSFASLLSLQGGTLDAQSSVDMNDAGNFVANSGGHVSVWNASGVLLNSFSLTGFTGGYPANRGIAATQDYLLTYDSGLLKAWDYKGNLLDSTSLIGAGNSFDSNFSLSFANNHVFVVDTAGGTWRGYDLGLGAKVNDVPEPASLALFSIALGAGIVARRRKSRV